MDIRRLTLGLLAGLALHGCVTAGPTADATTRSMTAAADCYQAANGQLPVNQGLASCNRALADGGLPPPLHAATLVNRGVLHMQVKAFDAALADYDAAIAAAPDAADAYINKGVALLNFGNRDAEAVEAFTAALARHPARPELVYYHRASAFEGLGRLRDAYDDYSEAAQLAPDWAEPANQLQRFRFVHRKTMAG